MKTETKSNLPRKDTNAIALSLSLPEFLSLEKELKVS